MKHWFGSHLTKETLFECMQALDLICYRHGLPEAINTSQNIYRMNPVYGHRSPLCVLTWGPQEFMQQLVDKLRKAKISKKFTVLPQGPLAVIWFVICKGIWRAPGLQFRGRLPWYALRAIQPMTSQLPVSTSMYISLQMSVSWTNKWGTEFLILMGVPMHRMSSDCCSQHVPRWQVCPLCSEWQPHYVNPCSIVYWNPMAYHDLNLRNCVAWVEIQLL